MLELLVRVIGTSSGKIQQLAQDTILQLGMASSGMGGMNKLPVFSDQNLVPTAKQKTFTCFECLKLRYLNVNLIS